MIILFLSDVLPLLLAVLFPLMLLAEELWIRAKTRQEDPYYQLKHPESEEMRAIYREIDRDVMITEPDLLTPEKPSAIAQGSRLIPLPEKAPQFWVNLLYSPDGKQAFTEMPYPRFAVEVEKDGDIHNLVSTVEFPKWEGNSALVMCALFNTAKGAGYIATFGLKSVMPGDIVRLNQVANRLTKHKRSLGSFPPAGVPRPGAGWLRSFTDGHFKGKEH